MKRAITLALVSSAAVTSASCSDGALPEEFYVFSPTSGDQYYRDMIEVVATNGLDANPGTADAGDGDILYVIEGTGRGVRVWSRNVLLSQRQRIACGTRGHNDQRQHAVRVSDWTFFGDSEVTAVAAALKSGLQAKGYEILTEPRACGATPG